MELQVGLDAQWILPKAAAGAGLRRFAEDVVGRGLDHVGVGDHISFRDGVGFDGLVSAMAMLASDPALVVRIQVYILPLRHPVLVARQLATVAEHAPGRLAVACGIAGEDRSEYWICGIDPATRGARADESLRALRQLMTGAPVDFEGRFFEFKDAWIAPAPAVTIPLIIGGRSDAAIERTARYGDGWQGMWVSPRRFGEAVEQIGARALELGREPLDWSHGMTFWCGFDHDGVPGARRVAEVMEPFYGMSFDRFARYTPVGTPDDIAAAIAPYIDAGCISATIVAGGLPADVAVELTGQVRDRLRAAQPG